MPRWIYYLTYFNPLRYTMAINRGIFLKGAGFTDILPNLVPLMLMGVVVFSLALMKLRKKIE